MLAAGADSATIRRMSAVEMTSGVDVVAAAHRLDKVIDNMSSGATPQQVLTELVRIRGLLGVLPDPPAEEVPGDDLIRQGVKSLAAAVVVLQSGAGTADQIVHLRGLERSLRGWVGRVPANRVDVTRRERAIALAAALRAGH